MKKLTKGSEEGVELSHEERITEAQRLLEDAGPLGTLEYNQRLMAATRVLQGEDPKAVAEALKPQPQSA